MKRMCVLMAVVAFAVSAFTGCGDENTKQINDALKDLDQRVSAMEAASKKGDKDAIWQMLWQAMDAQAAVNALVDSPAWKASKAKRYDAFVARMTGTYKEGGNKDDGASNTAMPSIGSAFKCDYGTDCAYIEGLTKEALGNGVIRSIVIPSTINDRPVTRINKSAFKGFKSLERVILPESLKEIGKEAFSGCTSLEQVTLPESLEKIGTCAFSGCASLERVTLLASLKDIGDSVFSECVSLKEVKLPASIEKLDGFYGCTALTSIDMSECTNLKEIESAGGGTGLDAYYYGAFEGSTSMKSITIPATVEKVDNGHFADGNQIKQSLFRGQRVSNQKDGRLVLSGMNGVMGAKLR